MTTEKMTIHRALAEKKMLDKKRNEALLTTVFVTHSTKGADSVGGIKKDKMSENICSDYQQIMDWERRSNAIYKAVTDSNAVTQVTIAGETMTVAQAIGMKNYAVVFLQDMLHVMSEQYANAQVKVANSNATLEERANKRITAAFGAVTSNNADDVEQTKQSFINSETAVLIDPLNIGEKISALRDRIDAFMSEVDAVLSESNAVTTIEITY